MAKRSRKRQQAEARAPETAAWIKGLDRDLYAIIAIVAVWIIAILLVNPKGNFPLNDDWCYGKAVFDLLRTHEYHLNKVVAMPILGQVVWAVPFCALLGSTFVALRISTLALALGGVLAAYGLLREARASRWVAFFGCMVIALNPLYLSLSHTFMTDVPCTAFTLIAVYFYVRGLRSDSVGMFVPGTAFACAAALTRQIGLFLPIGFGIAYLVRYGIRVRSVLRAAAPVVIVAAAYLSYVYWLKSTHRLPGSYNYQSSMPREFLALGPAGWIQSALAIAVTSYLYLGLLLLPFLVLSVSRNGGALTLRQRSVSLLISSATAVIVMWMLIRDGRWMPFGHLSGNYIEDFGIGPPLLPDVWVRRLPNYPSAPQGLWIGVTVLAVIGGALLMWHLLSALHMPARRESSGRFDKAFLALLLTVAAMNLVLLLPLSTFIYYDRYYLSAICMITVAVAVASGPSPRVTRMRALAGVALLTMMAAFSIGGTHDYLTWNRLRWRAAAELMRSEKISANDLDGGPEFNVWHNPDASQGWVARSDRYIIAFGAYPGYHEIREYPYRRWLPPHDAAIYVLAADH